MIEIFLGEK